MTVRHIMQLKGSTAVETIAPETKVAEAVARLAARRIGALVVSRTGEDVIGILSERDIVRHLGETGPSALGQPVSTIMTAEVKTCALSETANSVLERMTEGRFRHMPVTQDGRMIGVLSIGDVVKARLQELAQENAAMADMLSG